VTLLASSLLAALATQSPADSLRSLALRLPESALATETRARPLAVREAVAQALAKGQLDAARNLAAAYALAWRDSFLVREVARFAAWPPERRAAKVWGDSVRRAGIAAFGQDGPICRDRDLAACVVTRSGVERQRRGRGVVGERRRGVPRGRKPGQRRNISRACANGRRRDR